MENKIGNTLKVIRVAAGINQAAMAKKLEITQNYLSLVENNHKEPSLSFLKKFASSFDIPLGYFLWLALDKQENTEEKELRDKMDILLKELLIGRRSENVPR